MRLRCASTPQFFDRLAGDRAVLGASPSSEIFFSFIRPLFLSFLFFF